MTKKYVVRLSLEERQELEELVSKGKAAAHKHKHAQILLKADIGKEGPGWIDLRISEAFDITTRTVEKVRQRLVEKGLESAINRAKRSGEKATKLNGEDEAHLVAITCSEPPSGNARWSIKIVAD